MKLVDNFFSHLFIEKLSWSSEDVAYHTQGLILSGTQYQVTFRKENLDIFIGTKESKNLKLDYIHFPDESKDLTMEYNKPSSK